MSTTLGNSSSSYAWRTTNPDVGPRAKCDQVIYEAVAKACEVIIHSRCPAGSTPTTKPTLASRFNLHLPEYPQVRKVLFPFKRSLHVPLRVDVYYNTAREEPFLLERWCVEYAPCHAAFFQEECTSLDPLVQLRHVCKKLVLWLRTLYCTSQLLPCQKSSRIDFSIHLSGQEADVQNLRVNLGFQQLSHSQVYTPYGRLDLQVLYAPKRVVAPLFPKQATAKWTCISSRPKKTASRPIPTSNSQELQQPPHSPQARVEPQSAPAHISNFYTTTTQPTVNTTNSPQGPVLENFRSKSYKSPIVNHHKQHARPIVSRTQSAVSDRDVTYEPLKQDNPEAPRQKRVLSGLSLAMMNADDAQLESPPPTRVVEQRRAALHHAPPFTERTSPRPSDYGYAYNNHIPWGHLNTGGTATMAATPPKVDSPALASTPPQPMFVGSSKTPPPHGATPPPQNITPSLLLPPMALSSTKKSAETTIVTPPFAALPTSLGETPRAAPIFLNTHQQDDATSLAPQAQAPISSLDLLHSSPFQQHAQNSILSSLSGTEHFPQSLSVQGLGPNAVPKSAFGSSNSASFFLEKHAGLDRDEILDHDEDAMPFAVDTTTPGVHLQVTAAMENSSSGGKMDLSASAALARQCATASRLALFESQQEEPKAEAVDSLALQLAEFKSFGASLMATTPASNNDDSSASTPIPLKT